MRLFADYNPIPVFIYFLAVTLTAMFCMNPVVLLLSLLGALSMFIARNGRRGWRFHLFILAAFVITALINPIFYHNGATVLAVVNDNPVTLEAVLYGVFAAVMLASVIYWFRSFSQIMTGDRLLYLFGSVSPKLALLLSMTLRYIPLFGAQTKKVNRAQRALGLYKDDNVVDSVRGGSRVLSVMVTWGLENGIITADSMAARGYGTGRRTYFSLYRFRKSDAALLAATLALSAVTLCAVAAGALDFSYYPRIDGIPSSPMAVAAYISYGMLALIPTITEAEERVKWNCLQSKI